MKIPTEDFTDDTYGDNVRRRVGGEHMEVDKVADEVVDMVVDMEVKIMKQREKGEMAHDVSPVTMFLH